MKGINIILLCMVLLGFLPLVSFLLKKKRYTRILKDGRTTWAQVFFIANGIKHNYEIVHYQFIAPDGRQYRGKLTTSPGAHQLNETIEIYYLPANPNHNTVKGAWSSVGFLVFMIAIALVVIFMAYKLYLMVNNGNA